MIVLAGSRRGLVSSSTMAFLTESRGGISRVDIIYTRNLARGGALRGSKKYVLSGDTACKQRSLCPLSIHMPERLVLFVP